MSAIGELFIQLGFKGDTKGAQEFKNAVDELAKKFGATLKLSNKTGESLLATIKKFRMAALAIMGAVYVLNRMTDTLLRSNQAWIDFSRQTDLAMENLQGYAAVASVLDKSLGMEGAAQGIANLEQRLYELQLTGQGAEGFMYAGINPMGKNAFQVLEELRERIRNLNNNQASFLLRQMGLDPKMLGMLRMTREEFEALNAQLKQYQLTEDQRKAMQKYQEQLSIAAKQIQYFKDRAILALLPFVVKLAKSFSRVVEGVSKAVKWIKDLYNSLDDVDKAAIKLNIAIAGIIAMILAFMANPAIAAFVAILTTIYLIVDDIMTYLQGGDSVLGLLLGAIDNIVEDERTPKWIRDLLFIISHAQELKNRIDEFIEDRKIKHQEEQKHPVKTLFEDLRNNNLTFMPFPMLGGLKSLADMQSVYKYITYQTNNIMTSEAANEVDNNLKHAQITAAAQAGN